MKKKFNSMEASSIILMVNSFKSNENMPKRPKLRFFKT